MYKVDDIANWFLSQNIPISNKKLQKLVYYAYAWYLTLSNEHATKIDDRLFENKFEAWIHGAVYPDLYHTYKQYGSSTIEKYKGKLPNFSEDTLDVLNQVLEVYGDYTGNELESICHQESPWQEARSGYDAYDLCTNRLKDETIFNCYSSRL